MSAAQTQQTTLGTDILASLGRYWIYSDYLGELLGKKVADTFSRFIGIHDYYAKKGELVPINGKKGIYTSLRKMKKTTGLSERTVTDHIGKILASGLMERIDRGRKEPVYILTESFWSLPERYAKEQQAKQQAERIELDPINDDWADALRASFEESDESVQENVQEKTVQETAPEQEENARLATISGSTRKSCDPILLSNITTRHIDDDYIYRGPEKMAVKKSPERVEHDRSRYSDALEALGDKLQDVLLWTDAEVRECQDYLLARTDWPGVYIESIVDESISRIIGRKMAISERYLAACIANETKTTLTQDRAAQYTEARIRQERELRRMEQKQKTGADGEEIRERFRKYIERTA